MPKQAYLFGGAVPLHYVNEARLYWKKVEASVLGSCMAVCLSAVQGQGPLCLHLYLMCNDGLIHWR